MRSVYWDYDHQHLHMIDQRLLPWSFEVLELTTYQAVARAITDMAVRGAPAIGAAGAFGLVLAAQAAVGNAAAVVQQVREAAAHLNAARPTAVNLSWAIKRQLNTLAKTEADSAAVIQGVLLTGAQRIADEDAALNKRMAFIGAELVNDGDTILHHCNTGALATIDWGTALGVIFAAHEQGKKIHVLVDETRPRLQGARLTTWELQQKGISFDLIVDSAAGHFMHRGEVNIVLVGSDRTAANGDVANKIGTYQLAVLARENGVPFYPVVPTSTIDLDLANGELIPIEERSPEEVVNVLDRPIAPAHISARNPAFDVTPYRYVTGIVTEEGIAYPPFTKQLAHFVQQARQRAEAADKST